MATLPYRMSISKTIKCRDFYLHLYYSIYTSKNQGLKERFKLKKDGFSSLASSLIKGGL